MLTSHFITPMASDRTFVGPSDHATIDTDNDIFFRQKPVDITAILHSPQKGTTSQLIAVKNFSLRHFITCIVAVEMAMDMI